VVYHVISIHSEEFRIYSKKDKIKDKFPNKKPENLKSISRNKDTDKPIKKAENAEIVQKSDSN
jgi:hypothetical protein